MRLDYPARNVAMMAALVVAAGCGSSDGTQGGFGGAMGAGGATGGETAASSRSSAALATGGSSLSAATTGGQRSTGGASAEGGAKQSGGVPATTGGRNTSAAGTGGSSMRATGGAGATGGATAAGTGTGGSGAKATGGGGTTSGGATAGGGASSATTSGGAKSSGGTGSSVTSAGGTTANGGASGVGGVSSGGATTNGGATGVGGATQTCPAGKAAPAAGNRRATLTHGGRSRSYILHVPTGLSASKPLAIVFDLHGAGGSGASQQSQSGWGNTADREGFLVVYPDGVDGYWNVDDTCCGTAGSQKIDDVGFIKAIVAQLSQDACVDARRVYVTGWSNGGGLTHRMGCDAADVIAAIAPVATDLRTQPCNAARAISMMEIRGMSDSLEPYEGGLVGPQGGQYLAVGAKASLKLWADINQCTGTPTTVDKYCESYTACKDGVESDLCSLPGVDHSPYQNSLNFSVSETAWKMFQRQPLR